MRKPFDGIKVLDFTQALAGVFCAMYMADFGADVIKVERFQYGDQSREWGPFGKDDFSAYYALFNHSKRSISLDLAAPEAKQIVMDLVKEADVVIENFKVGTLDRLGIGYDEMVKVNPGIIYGSVSGFGMEGPLREFACYDITAAARSGLMDRSGEPNGAPIKPGFSLGDNWSGSNFISGLSMALLNKQATGKGCRFDIAMLDCVFYLMELPVMEYFHKGYVTPKNGNHDTEIAPAGIFAAKDGFISIFCANEKQWQSCCAVLGLNDLISDPRFVTNDLRLKNLAQLITALETVTATMAKKELERLLCDNRVSAGYVATIRDLMEDDEQLKASEMLVPVEHPVLGPMHVMGLPVKLSKTPGSPHRFPAAKIGEHAPEILSDLGYAPEIIAELKEKNVFFVSDK